MEPYIEKIHIWLAFCAGRISYWRSVETICAQAGLPADVIYAQHNRHDFEYLRDTLKELLQTATEVMKKEKKRAA